MATNNKTPRIPNEYTPISMWGYFGYNILFMIPVIGFILTIVFAFTAPNINLRNYARSQFCVWIVLLILTILISVITFMIAGPGVIETLPYRY